MHRILGFLDPAVVGLVRSARADGPADCCSFIISSAGSFSLPAGSLEDGQIRLNGTCNTTTFCINKQGGITDSRGHGCIVTESPTSQFQCDRGKAPDTNFFIGNDKTLVYKGSPTFFACPATDTEYNIYVSPNFGQTKCFPIRLQSDGCGEAKLSCPSAPAPTLWATEWVTDTVNYTITATQKLFVTSCPVTPVPPSNSTRSCTNCYMNSTTAWTNNTFRILHTSAPGDRTSDPGGFTIQTTTVVETAKDEETATQPRLNGLRGRSWWRLL
ncbi:uncharacterized protein E0L32_006304 [Thyridium curvatum]|uniref:Cell wall mannoprotein PIR1-like C-terminal domain-containing protein n=1 Tax=Thyridium curvatum TaxID=1093900 RepID=A0A507B8D7_9PEZI|nr:uncharacterized protein E0L32_006304 [Thyridium curvatum]TPX13331.1 hypothetical protein E0L32_006304 [Thyridium curvatum]